MYFFKVKLRRWHFFSQSPMPWTLRSPRKVIFFISASNKLVESVWERVTYRDAAHLNIKEGIWLNTRVSHYWQLHLSLFVSHRDKTYFIRIQWLIFTITRHVKKNGFNHQYLNCDWLHVCFVNYITARRSVHVHRKD